MKWYYAEGKNPVGPFEEDEFAELVENGTVPPETLVWRTGMKAWKPLSEVDSAGAKDAPVEERRGGSSGLEGEETSGESESESPGEGREAWEAEYERIADEKECAECGGTFSADDMVRFGDRWICGGCKPLFAQKLREGLAAGGEMRYAGFWLRAGAKTIDVVILWAVGIAMLVVAGMAVPMDPESDTAVVVPMVVNLLQMIVAAGYTTYFLGKFSATPGKMAFRLKVVTPEGEPISYKRACGRYFAELLSSIFLCIGYLLAVFDEERRTLHDRVVNTRVVRTN